MKLRGLLACALGLATPWTTACVVPHCTSPDYGDAECRVIAENEVARLLSAEGVELRFQDPNATDDGWWDARGLLTQLDDGTITARVAGPGGFALSMRAPAEVEEDTAVALRLLNVDPIAALTVGPTGAPAEVPASTSAHRELELLLAPNETVWVRGDRPCPSRYRMAFVGDIQTNPTQFGRIIERINQEVTLADDPDSAEAPLVGLVIVGDLTESSRDDEFEAMRELLVRAPIPVAVTPGNHDIYRPLRPHFNRSFGPGNHSFDVCGVHVALLDSGSGSIAPSVLARAPELLDRGDAQFLVAGMHHPPYAGLTGSGWSREDHAAALLAELARERADLIVAGHNHALRAYDVDIGGVTVPEVIVGTGGASQGVGIPRFGYLQLTFDDNAETMERCFVEVPPLGYAEPPNDGSSAAVPYCAEP